VRLPLARALVSAILFIAIWILAAPQIAKFLVVRSEPFSADAVIVLSGSAVYDERLSHAIRIYQEGRARSVILTDDGLRRGWSRRRQANPLSVERGIDTLVGAGIQNDRIIRLPQSVTSTYDEAVALREYALRSGLRSVVVVTSPYHSRRALWTFRRVLEPAGVLVGIDPVFPAYQSLSFQTWWLQPKGWQNVALEYLKLAYYFARRH
jgi:uncharacterized SAM-binding protein YcdF (DUF218 family)